MGRVSKRSAKKRESLHNYKERSTRMKLEVENSKLVHFRFNIRSSNFTNNTKKYKWHLNQEWKWRKLSRARCELIAAIDIYPELSYSSANKQFSQCRQHFVLWPASAWRWNGKPPGWGNMQLHQCQVCRPRTVFHRMRTCQSQQTQELPVLHLRQWNIRTYQYPLLLIGINRGFQTQVHIMFSCPFSMAWQALLRTDSLQYSEHKLSIQSRQMACVQLHVRCALLFLSSINWTCVSLMLGFAMTKPPFATVTTFKHPWPTVKRADGCGLRRCRDSFPRTNCKTEYSDRYFGKKRLPQCSVYLDGRRVTRLNHSQCRIHGLGWPGTSTATYPLRCHRHIQWFCKTTWFN